jgi:hypothetical protein
MAATVAALGLGTREGKALPPTVMDARHVQFADPPATHGMLLFGEKKIYLSHLPMFSVPVHRYQVILEATLTKSGSDPQAAYVQDRSEHTNTKVYTFEPEPFVLPDLDPGNARRNSFKGTIFRGHFERGGEVIGSDVIVNVTRVIHFRQFDAQAAELPQLEYLIFGLAQELFTAHLITRPPDFDHVLAIKSLSRRFTDEELGKGIAIIFPGKANKPAEKLAAVKRLSGKIKNIGGSPFQEIGLEMGKEIYFEASELAS